METKVLKNGKEIKIYNGEVVNSVIDDKIITEKALINEIKYLKSVGRKAIKFTKKELDKKILKKAQSFGYRGNDVKFALQYLVDDSTIKKDLKRINFSPEKFPRQKPTDLEGFLKTFNEEYPKYIRFENGFNCYLTAAYSMGQKDKLKNGVFNITYPVYYIIYFDGEKLRAYIPTLGNMYNVKYNCAYGREPEIEALKSDSIYSKAEVDSKCWEVFRKHKESFSNLTWEKEVNGKNYHNEKLMMIDIENNIIIK